ncbi:hypothetical protein MnTg02_02608 [bacterium MnTg02]|nr:hypothetical protein MnTg02_02608 [bacterium MnTg02]
MRKWRAHKRRLQEPRQLDVVDKLATSGQKVRIFKTLDALANEYGTVHVGFVSVRRDDSVCSPRISAAASMTAATIPS